MTKRKNYPRLRNGKSEGTDMPPHFIDEKKKEVVFHIPGGFPVVMVIPTWMQAFPKDSRVFPVGANSKTPPAPK